jgi:hypothetical protein
MLPNYEKDIKHTGAGEAKGDDKEMFVRAGRRRPLATAFGLVAICYLVWTSVFKSGGTFHHLCGGLNHKLQVPGQVVAKKALVPLEAHIMSKCPDATVSFMRML